MHGSNFSPRLHQRATEQHESPPPLSQTTIIALPSHHIHHGLTCCPPVIVRQQTAEPIVIVSACFIYFFILFSGRRLRCAGALRGLRSLPGYSSRVACAHWLCLHHTEEFSYKSVVDHFSKGKNIYIYILCASVLLLERAAVEQGDVARRLAAVVQLLPTLKLAHWNTICTTHIAKKKVFFAFTSSGGRFNGTESGRPVSRGRMALSNVSRVPQLCIRQGKLRTLAYWFSRCGPAVLQSFISTLICTLSPSIDPGSVASDSKGKNVLCMAIMDVNLL